MTVLTTTFIPTPESTRRWATHQLLVNQERSDYLYVSSSHSASTNTRTIDREDPSSSTAQQSPPPPPARKIHGQDVENPAIRQAKTKYGPQHPVVAATFGTLARQFLDGEQWDHALEAYESALDIYRSRLEDFLLREESSCSSSSSNDRDIRKLPPEIGFSKRNGRTGPTDSPVAVTNIEDGLVPFHREKGNGEKDRNAFFFMSLKKKKKVRIIPPKRHTSRGSVLSEDASLASFLTPPPNGKEKNGNPSTPSNDDSDDSSVEADDEVRRVDLTGVTDETDGSSRYSTCLDAINGAAVLQNEALIHRQQNRPADATECYREALAFYRVCWDLVDYSNGRAMDIVSALSSPGRKSSVTRQRRGHVILLEHKIIQTLSALANALIQSKDTDGAIKAYNEVVSFMMMVGVEDVTIRKPPAHGRLSFQPLTRQQRLHFVVASLNNIGQLKELYKKDEGGALAAYREALTMLRTIEQVSTLEPPPKPSCVVRDDKDATNISDDETALRKVDLRIDLANTLMNLGGMYKHLGENRRAVESFNEAWRVRHALYRSGHHPDVVDALYKLGSAYEHGGSFRDAMSCYEHVFLLRRQQSQGKSAVDNSSTSTYETEESLADVLNDMSNVLQKSGNLDKARLLTEEALRAYRDAGTLTTFSVSEMEETTTTTTFTRGVAEESKDDSKKRQSLQQKIAGVLYNRGSIYASQGALDNAEKDHDEALELRSSSLGPRHPDVSQSWNALGMVHVLKNSFDTAHTMLERSLRIDQCARGGGVDGGDDANTEDTADDDDARIQSKQSTLRLVDYMRQKHSMELERSSLKRRQQQQQQQQAQETSVTTESVIESTVPTTTVTASTLATPTTTTVTSTKTTTTSKVNPTIRLVDYMKKRKGEMEGASKADDTGADVVLPTVKSVGSVAEDSHQESIPSIPSGADTGKELAVEVKRSLSSRESPPPPPPPPPTTPAFDMMNEETHEQQRLSLQQAPPHRSPTPTPNGVIHAPSVTYASELFVTTPPVLGLDPEASTCISFGRSGGTKNGVHGASGPSDERRQEDSTPPSESPPRMQHLSRNVEMIAPDGTVLRFVGQRPFSGDDSVSQITFQENDQVVAKPHRDGASWWGSSTNGKVSGWFHSTYVADAMEALQDMAFAVQNRGKARRTPSPSQQGPRRLGMPETRVGNFENHHHEAGHVVKDSDDSDDDLRSNIREQGIEVSELPDTTVPVISSSVSILAAAESEPHYDPQVESENIDEIMGCMRVVHGEMDKEATRAPTFSEVLRAEASRGCGGGGGVVVARSLDGCRSGWPDCVSPTPSFGSLPSALTHGIIHANDGGCTASPSELQEQLEKVKKQRKELGSKHPQVVATLLHIASLCRQRGDADRSIRLYEDVVRTQRETMGENSLQVASTLHALSDARSSREEWEEAIEALERAMAIETSLHGNKDHPQVAHTLNAIGKAQRERGNFDEAMDAHHQALNMHLRCFAPRTTAPPILETLVMIGEVYYKERNSVNSLKKSTSDEYQNFIESGMLEQVGKAHEERGEYKLARSFYEEELQILHCKKGSTAHAVANTLNSLGILRRKVGETLEATDYHLQALKLQQESSKVDKTEVSWTWVLIGMKEHAAGRAVKALQMYDEGLATLRTALPKTHRRRTLTMVHRAVTLRDVCRFVEAKQVLEDTVNVLKAYHGEDERDHMDILSALLELGRVRMDLGETKDTFSAADFFQDILHRQRTVLAPLEMHPAIADVLQSLGDAQVAQRDYAAASKSYEECYRIRTISLGRDHYQVASTLHSIGDMHAAKGRYEKSSRILRDALRLSREVRGESHLQVAQILYSEATVKLAMGRTTEASECLDEARTIAQAARGPSHILVADIWILSSQVLAKSCAFDSAREKLNEGLTLYRSFDFSEEHPKIVEAVAVLQRLERDEALCV